MATIQSSLVHVARGVVNAHPELQSLFDDAGRDEGVFVIELGFEFSNYLRAEISGAAPPNPVIQWTPVLGWFENRYPDWSDAERREFQTHFMEAIPTSDLELRLAMRLFGPNLTTVLRNYAAEWKVNLP